MGRTVNDGPFRPLGILFETLEIGSDEIFSDGFESGDAAA